MKICQQHWIELRQAIDTRHLGHLVAKSGEEAVERLKMQTAKVDKPTDYDPLMNASLMITTMALKYGGSYLMRGEYCPLCEAEKHSVPGMATHWIRDCTDSILEHCQQAGLMKPEDNDERNGIDPAGEATPD